ncbi:MAG: hypothetical protein R2708_17360 [Vicinamibacterales bacterium]
MDRLLGRIRQRCEARDVVGGNRLDMFEAVAATRAGAGLALAAASKASKATSDGAVADGVNLHLPAALVEHGDDAVLLGRHVGRAGAARAHATSIAAVLLSVAPSATIFTMPVRAVGSSPCCFPRRVHRVDLGLLMMPPSAEGREVRAPSARRPSWPAS